ncbi:hypothetical protein [Staphylococcus saprophyticus]|uniref:Uncharacterized protein n=1 Tax=Staphylococcus saprophyticus TaxID=29385 RepID=A0A380HKP2_STASA|nr:hypothetical protein [Staphylococcus saprophyticus]SUM82634.1 Uncharacterised protein [Staphylococcus saprophyticus]
MEGINKEILNVFEKNNLNIPNIPENRNYWLLRTEGGNWYEEFTSEKFIAIGWNKLDKKDYCESVNKELALRILDNYYPENKQQTLVINNINKFYNKMKIGDIVILPSEGSQVLMFCEITSDVYNQNISQTEIDEGNCPYVKRRKIKTIKLISKRNLDLKLFKMLQSHHTISDINDYSNEIDSSLHDFYVKGEKIVYSIKINKKTTLSAENLRTLTNIPWIANEYLHNDFYNLSDLMSTIYIKSPGKQEYEGKGKNAAKYFVGFCIISNILLGGKVEIKNFTIETNGLAEEYIKINEQKLKEDHEKNRHQEEMEKLKLQGEAEVPDINKYKKTPN